MTVNYNSIRFGPIYAKDEREVRHIFEFFNDKIRKYEFKNHKVPVGKGFSPTSAAVQAKWALPSDVVQYIEKSLTKKEMKKKTVGRKSINYPKRSKIIKIGPVEDLPEISEKENIESNSKNVSFNLDDCARGIKPKLKFDGSECDKKYESKLLLNNHFKIDHLFYCSKCPNFYENERSLKDHVILMH